jgi:hypothetical protein
MKTLKFATLSLLVAFALITSLAVVRTTFADNDKSNQQGGDNKVIVTNVPMGDSVQVIPFGTAIGGRGNIPDNSGQATAYAPIGKISQVLLWDQKRGYVLLATVNPATTWPDTVVSAAGH